MAHTYDDVETHPPMCTRCGHMFDWAADNDRDYPCVPAPVRGLLPEASALWLEPGTPARPLSLREMARTWWMLEEWRRRVLEWWRF